MQHIEFFSDLGNWGNVHNKEQWSEHTSLRHAERTLGNCTGFRSDANELCTVSEIGRNPISGSTSYTETVLDTGNQCIVFNRVECGRQVEGIEKCALTLVDVPICIVHDIK